MGHGTWQVFTVTMASGGSLSTHADLGGGYPTAYLEVSSTPSQSAHQIRAAYQAAGPFNTVYHPSINSSTVAANAYTIPSGVTGALVPIPGGIRFLKVYATAAMDNGANYRIHIADE